MSTEVTTDQMNETIARFMGGVHENQLDTGMFMRFHTSWDWLMPVVEKIGSLAVKSPASYNPDLRFRIEIVNGYTKIEGTGEVIFFNSSIEGSMLMATYKAVYQFITWYNQQKQTNEQ